MDPVTQGLLGSCASQASLQKKHLIAIWLIGLIAGMAPDLDIVIRSSHDPLLFIKYHRHFTHSLFFIPIGGSLVSALFLFFNRAMRSHWKIVWLAACIGYATHGILDTCTSYGTLLLWPLNNTRYAFDIFPIVHPIYTFILFVGVFLAHIYQIKKPALIAMALSLGLLGLGYRQHVRAITWQQSMAAKRQHHIEHGRVMPSLATIRYWRSYYVANKHIYYDTLHVPLWGDIQKLESLKANHFSRHDLPVAITQNQTLMRDFNIFSWFTDNYLIELSHKPLILGDGRYLLRIKQPITVLWGIEFPEQAKPNQHIKWLRYYQPRDKHD